MEVNVVPSDGTVFAHFALERLCARVYADMLLEALLGGETLAAVRAPEVSHVRVCAGHVLFQPRRLLVGVTALLAHPRLPFATRIMHF